jgi:tetratricopeptide (TPR) repeat protein
MGKKIKKRTQKVIQNKQAPSPGHKKEKKRSILPWLFALTVITVLCFFPMLKNGFTNWDDDFYVLNNALLRGPDWIGIFSKPVVSNYHPITIMTLAMNYGISGTDPWSYLFFNLVLHLINAIVVFIFIYRISGQKIIVAFLTSLLFSIHPLHVESVAWISERKDLLYTLFFILSLIQYWRFAKSGKKTGLWLSFLFFLLSILSKPAAIVLPLVLFLLDHWSKRSFSKKLIIEKVPFFLVAALFTILTLKLQSVTAITSLDVYPIWVRLFFASYVAMIYFFRFFFSYPLSSFHPFPSPDNLGLAVYLSPLFIIALIVFLWYFRKNRLVSFGIGFFLVNILLVLQLISIGYTIVSERYTYVPYIGLAFLLAMLVEKYFRTQNKIAWSASVLFFGFFGFLSFNRTKVWKDSDELWSNVIGHYPNAAMARGERAQYIYNKAITMAPKEAEPLFHRVVEDCTVAINNDRDSLKNVVMRGAGSIYNMRGTSFFYLKQYDSAISDFNAAVRRDPYDDHIVNFRGTIFFNAYKDYNKALSDFSKAININPQADYYLNRSRCYYMLGDNLKAKEDVQSAMQKGATVSPDYRKLFDL